MAILVEVSCGMRTSNRGCWPAAKTPSQRQQHGQLLQLRGGERGQLEPWNFQASWADNQPRD